MKIRLDRFNTYLLLLVLSMASGWGCHTESAAKKAPKKGYRALRLHLEVNADGTDKSKSVTIGRESHFALNVNKAAFVDENNLAKVSVVDDGMGGYSLRIQLDRQGTWLLEQFTVANKGRHIAIFAELEDYRWLAAPLITRRISDGVFSFTPDASREEADKLVLGLSKTIKKVRSKNTFNDPEVK